MRQIKKKKKNIIETLFLHNFIVSNFVQIKQINVKKL